MDQVEKIQKEVEKLHKDLQEQTEIATRAQRDYVNLKLDFDRYQRQTAEKEQDLELMSLLSSVKKFLPFVEDLRKSLANIPEEHKSDPLAHGVQLVYNNFLKTLE
jgi:molecular chaperone GrpE (heat shock protein)